ncbi:chitobiase/beta-hexosaminidase C-terminal domain-containing protein [Bacillus sp. EB106-08-02-XG196]|uniref:lamin tail domain-containing protein n=1 Tax=Bacillus sp. EB106-08-02-XG196 TaxID=2737049 RepID=UPI0015C464B5|nr:FN3 associated domain-containing protein [Bacillus sp. EB106-08-02-XG196]NWQ44055.1 chitobiase/beta-hexosaminidase C-terminal domain-containing protein [Bacillus sp. EB106-08-02-XG196]
MNRRHKKRLSMVTVPALLISLFSPVANTTAKAETSVATDLIISEYIEGSSFNKAIELYNGTGAEINLSGYTLEHYNNSGSAITGTTTTDKVLLLDGKLAAGDTYVISRSDADPAIAAVTDKIDDSKQIINFNGNDQIVLKKNGSVIDSIGQVGSVEISLADVSLVRNSDVLKGDTIINDPFDNTKEWTNLGKDTFSNLGEHTLGGSSEEEPTEPEAPLEAITVAEAREAGAGQTVTIEGIATTKNGLWGYDTFYMQDETAGMLIYSSPKDVQPGDKVKITGKLLTYKNELELQPTNMEIISSGNNFPEAQVIAPTANEDTQGELVKLENITITALESDSYGTAIFQAKTETGDQVRVIHDNRTGSDYYELIKHYKEGDKVHLKGIGSIDNDGYHVKTFGLESYDLVNKPAVYVEQAEGTVPAGTKIELKSGIEGPEIYYTIDGSVPTIESTKYVEPIALNTGDTTIKAIAVTGDNVSEVFSFTYTILNTVGVKIRDIQGKGHVSKYNGSSVTGITGVVTHVISGSTFIIQDDNADDDKATSEAIQVYKSSHGMLVGDKVTVDGIVEEYGGGANLSKTEINVSALTKTGTAELPTPLVVGKDIMPPNKIIDNDEMKSFDPNEDGIDFWESVEFMRVSFPNAKVVGPPYSGDVPIVVESTTNNIFNVNGGLNIAADDYNPEKVFLDNVGNSKYLSGDQFKGDVVGVISYSSSGFQLLTDKETLPEVTRANIQPEVTNIAPAEDKLTVATYNMENFSNNKSNTPDEKVVKIAKTFVNNMKTPDIITLVEVQDNDGETDSGNADATESYERLIAAIKAENGPAYEWTDVTPVNNDNGGAPGGNIRVGYLYNPDRVTFVEGTKGTDTQANAWSETGNLTLNPGVIEPSKFPDTRKPIAAELSSKVNE